MQPHPPADADDQRWIAPPAKPPGLGARVRAWFLTGVVIAGPLAVTAWLVWWFVDTVDQWVKPLVPPDLWPDTYLPVRVPGTGVLLAFCGLTLLGFFAANLAGRTLIKLSEMILDRMPIVRGIYKSVKQIFETIFAQTGTSFRKVGLVEFPAKGMWSLVFISTPPGDLLAGVLPEGAHLSVFLPCTPNPTTGFFFYLPARDVVEVPLTTEQAAKIIMSAGLLQPETQAALGTMAANARKPKTDEQAS
jgi:uncharacterized membrane protein